MGLWSGPLGEAAESGLAIGPTGLNKFGVGEGGAHEEANNPCLDDSEMSGKDGGPRHEDPSDE